MGKSRSSRAVGGERDEGLPRHKHKKDKKSFGEKGVQLSDLHSANAWEEVRFESEERKEKFLRLMGAQKQRKRTGGSQIGANSVIHTRAGTDVEEIRKNLERQFTEGLEYKSHWNRHVGLGCSSEGSSSLLQDHSVHVNEVEESKTLPRNSKYTINFVKSSGC